MRGPLIEPHGWVADLGALEAELKAAAGELDHGLLNEHPGLEAPTLSGCVCTSRVACGRAFPRSRALASGAPPSASAAPSTSADAPARRRPRKGD